MALPNTGLISAEDLKNNPDQVASTLSDFISNTNTLLRNGLTLGNNVASQYNDITLYIADSPNPYPFGFNWKFTPILPKGCQIIQADAADGQERISSALFPRWFFIDGNNVIKGIRGVFQTGYTYNMRFVTYA